MFEIQCTSRKKYVLGVILSLLFVFSVASIVWYSPVLFKGYATYRINTNILAGRNVSQAGLYSTENDLNVFLSSSQIKEQGHLSSEGNKLTALLYGEVFRITEHLEPEQLVLFSVFLHSLTLIVFTLLVLYLFNFKTALIFSFIYIFLPLNWYLPYVLGSYEFALFFFSLFFLLYFYGIKQKRYYLYLIIAGLSLALAGMAREALLIFIPFFIAYLWLIKKRKEILYIFIPFAVLLALIWLPSLGSNAYLLLFTTNISEEVKSADYAYYGHIYSDPYSYHFERENFLNSLKTKIDNGQLDFMSEIDRVRELKNMGIEEISFFGRVKAGFSLFIRHVFRFVSLEKVGGPLILLLMLFGLFLVRRKDKSQYYLFIFWPLYTMLFLAFIALAGRNHLMDFSWVLALLASLGLLALIKLSLDFWELKDKKRFFFYLVSILFVFYHLVLAGHVIWNQKYEYTNNLEVIAYSQEIKKLDILSEDVIAMPLDAADLYSLNYITDKSMVLFQPKTIKKLIKEEKLGQVLEEFNVRYILGYSDSLTKEIIGNAEVINIASDSIEIKKSELSRNRGWLLNLIN